MFIALLVFSCGYIPHGQGSVVQTASSTRSSSPSGQASASPSAFLEPGNCSGPSTGSPSITTKPLGMDSISLTIPAAWSDHTSQVTGAGALLFLQAPASYGSDSVTLLVQSIPGPRPGSSSHKQAVQDAAASASLGPESPISDCTVGGEQASFYRYQDSSGSSVSKLLVLHSPTSKYPFLYVVEVSSHGAVDLQAMTDVRAILGSWTWGPPNYDPNV